jgi:N-acetylgalactosamine-6-sulfatase
MVLDTLKEQGLDENTLVIFSSDNGPERTGTRKQMTDNSTGPGHGTFYSVGESGGLKGRKRSLYAGGIRVPFIARWPGVIPAGKTDRDSVLTAVDLLPTFMDLAEAKLPADYEPDGVSMVSALKGNTFSRDKPIFWEWRAAKEDPKTWPYQGIREGDWKLLVNEKLGKAELYDIETDWAESTNLAGDHPETVEKLKMQLATWTATLPMEPPASCFSKHRKTH